MRNLLAAIMVTLTASSALTTEPPPYLDDRSSPEQLLRSFYNAINRKEYARAWDYFGETKPARDFDTFVKGYANTHGVRVVTGQPGVEGAAGSTYYNLPVAIGAFSGDSDTPDVFGGCYTVRAVNATVQDPPFKPMEIEKGSLKPAEGMIDDALPRTCGDAPVPEPHAEAVTRAKAMFVAAYRDSCDVLTHSVEAVAPEPDIHVIKFHGKDDDPSAPEREMQLLRFYCGAGAYNEIHHYYLAVSDGVAELQFARPELNIRYENGDSDGKVEDIRITGFSSDGALINSDWDEKNRTITDYAKWRGVGDAFTSATYQFQDGVFRLVHYDVDASYDGEIDPQTVLDYATAP